MFFWYLYICQTSRVVQSAVAGSCISSYYIECQLCFFRCGCKLCITQPADMRIGRIGPDPESVIDEVFSCYREPFPVLPNCITITCFCCDACMGLQVWIISGSCIIDSYSTKPELCQ